MKLVCHLREARGKRKIQDIVDASGVSQPYVSQIESGRRLPTDEQVEALAPVYGLELDEWYEWRAPQFVAIELDAVETP